MWALSPPSSRAIRDSLQLQDGRPETLRVPTLSAGYADAADACTKPTLLLFHVGAGSRFGQSSHGPRPYHRVAVRLKIKEVIA